MEKKRKIKLIISLVVLLLFGIIILQNTRAVTTTILFFEFAMPLAGLLLATFVVGVITGWLVFAVRRKK